MSNKARKLDCAWYGPAHMRRLGFTFQWGYHSGAHTPWMLSVYLFARYLVLTLIRK